MMMNIYLQSDRSRGFGFITMSTVEEAGRCIKELNGVVSLFPPRLVLGSSYMLSGIERSPYSC